EGRPMRGILAVVAAWTLVAALARSQDAPPARRVQLNPPTNVQQGPAPRPEPAGLTEDTKPPPMPPRPSIRADFGDGVGYTRGFTYLEGFVPLYQPSEESVLFADTRVVNFDDLDRWEVNAGGGYRFHTDWLDGVWGANAFYDGRRTE